MIDKKDDCLATTNSSLSVKDDESAFRIAVKEALKYLWIQIIDITKRHNESEIRINQISGKVDQKIDENSQKIIELSEKVAKLETLTKVLSTILFLLSAATIKDMMKSSNSPFSDIYVSMDNKIELRSSAVLRGTPPIAKSMERWVVNERQWG